MQYITRLINNLYAKVKDLSDRLFQLELIVNARRITPSPTGNFVPTLTPYPVMRTITKRNTIITETLDLDNIHVK